MECRLQAFHQAFLAMDAMGIAFHCSVFAITKESSDWTSYSSAKLVGTRDIESGQAATGLPKNSKKGFILRATSKTKRLAHIWHKPAAQSREIPHR